MTRKEVIVKTITGELTWIQAADILGITARHLRRLKQRWERHGYDGLVDYRGGKPRRTRIALATIEQVCTLQRQRYPDFSVQHFWEQLGPVHGLEISYTLPVLVSWMVVSVDGMAHVKCFYVDGDDWRVTDFELWLTRQQPTQWSMANGRPVNAADRPLPGTMPDGPSIVRTSLSLVPCDMDFENLIPGSAIITAQIRDENENPRSISPIPVDCWLGEDLTNIPVGGGAAWTLPTPFGTALLDPQTDIGIVGVATALRVGGVTGAFDTATTNLHFAGNFPGGDLVGSEIRLPDRN